MSNNPEVPASEEVTDPDTPQQFTEEELAYLIHVFHEYLVN